MQRRDFSSFIFRLSFAALVLAPLVSLAACQAPPPTKAFADLTWSHLSPYTFNVGKVELVSKYQAPITAPNVEHLFPVSPEAAALAWGRDRLRAVGGGQGAGSVRYTLLNASVVEVPLAKKSEGVEGYFTDEQSERYDLLIEVMVEVFNDRNFREGIVTATAQRSQSVPDGITLDEREQVWFDMTEKAMKVLNATLEKNINAFLTPFLVAG